MEKVISFILVFLIIIGYSSYTVRVENAEDLVMDDVILSDEAKELHRDCQFILYDSIKANSFSLQEGLTVIYGDNIVINNIFEDKSLAANLNVTPKTSNKISDDLDRETTFSNTYMVLFMKNGNKIDVNYIRVEYAQDVAIETINKFIEAEHSKGAIEEYVNDFIIKQIADTSSAYNRVSNQAQGAIARNSSTTQVVLSVRDQTYYIANYVTTASELIPSNTYPVVIYKNDITYQAISIANALEDSELYVIVAFVTVTPGNCMSSSTNAWYASMSEAGLYNDYYGNAISIKAVKTSFENLFPEYDYFIDMSPEVGLSDAGGLTVPVSIGIPPSISTSFNINVCSGPRTDMDVIFNPNGISSVKFEAYKKSALFSTEPCLITNPFSYVAGVYMESGGQVLYMNVATTIKYYFVNKRETSGIWAGCEREMYYDNYQP
ncbi:MAG: hypothetical protein IJY39_12640 [Clostridia bacterium]|nr:hypothetical protein [Clostridia bacterium]